MSTYTDRQILLQILGAIEGQVPGDINNVYLQINDPGSIRLTRIADLTLSGHKLVVPVGDGHVELADNNILSHADRVVWMTTQSALEGEPVEVLAFGSFDEMSWSWTPLMPIYLGEMGELTQTPPDVSMALFSWRVAIATTPTRIFFAPAQVVILA